MASVGWPFQSVNSPIERARDEAAHAAARQDQRFAYPLLAAFRAGR